MDQGAEKNDEGGSINPNLDAGGEGEEEEVELISENDILEEVGVLEPGDLENFDDDDDNESMEEESERGQSPDRSAASLVFRSHEDSVYCVALEVLPGGVRAMSGSGDDTARLWNSDSGEEISLMTPDGAPGGKGTDSVTNVGFSHDGKYVAAGDMAGNVRVWDLSTGSQVFDAEVDDLEFLIWHWGANVLLGGDRSGVMWMWRVPSGDCRTFAAPSNVSGGGAGGPVYPQNARILPDGERAVVGYSDGALRMWNLKSQDPSKLFEGEEHAGERGEVTCLTVHPDAAQPLVMAGSIDCIISVYNYNSGRPVARFDASRPKPAGSNISTNGAAASNGTGSEVKDDTNSVEATAFFKSHPLIAAGTLVGDVLIFHLPSQTLQLRVTVGDGVVRLVPRPVGEEPLLYVAHLGGSVKLVDARSGSVVGEWGSHRGAILDLAVASDGSRMVTGGDDGTVMVFKLSEPER